jgi:hypothetical protein
LFLVIFPVVGLIVSMEHETLTFVFIGLTPALCVIGVCSRSYEYLRLFEDPFNKTLRGVNAGSASIALSVVNVILVMVSFAVILLR